MYKVNWDFKCTLKTMGFKIIFILAICSWTPIEEISTSVEITKVFLVFSASSFVMKLTPYQTCLILIIKIIILYRTLFYVRKKQLWCYKAWMLFYTLICFAFGAKQMNTIFLFRKKSVLSDSYKHINQIK